MEYNELTAGDLVTHGTFLFYDDADKTIWITRDGDQMYTTTEWKNVDALLRDNQAAANEFSNTGGLGELQQVASVPVGIYQQWDKEGIVDDPDAFARRLNNGDFAKFRTNSLRV